MPATTEIVNLNLVAGGKVGDPDNEAAQVLKECGDQILQQDGAQQMQFGMQIENPELLTLFISMLPYCPTLGAWLLTHVR